jgi:hypothetical protein
MAQVVVNGATVACTFAMPPGMATLTVLPARRVNAGSQPAATIMDHAPFVNIASFGMCMSPSNPQVVAATAAALGVPTPQPCLPVIPAPWAPGSPTVLIGGVPALTNTSQCMCAWGGLITVTMPGQVSVNSV